jgi:hypothetical protein
VIRSYSELRQVPSRRAHELDVSRLVLDEVAGLPSGYCGKVLGAGQVKTLGPISMGPILGALGLALVVVEDTEQLERVRPQLTKRKIRVAAAPSAGETQPQRDAAPSV